MDNKDFLKSKGKSIETIDHYRLTKRQSHGWCKYKKVQYRCTASKNLYDLTTRTAATSCGVRGESNKENLFFLSPLIDPPCPSLLSLIHDFTPRSAVEECNDLS